MKKNITITLAQKMILGSSIYSTGGGYEKNVQEKQFTILFKKKKSFPLFSIDELSDNDYICTAYAVGSAANTNYDLSKAFSIGLKTLENYLGNPMKGVFAGETNIDVLAFQTAAHMNLPVIDADCTGGRAVPEIQFDNFALFDKTILPLVAVTPAGDVVLLTHSKNLESIEYFVRNVAISAKKGLVAVLDHPVQVKEARTMLTLGIFERSIKLGSYIEKHKNKKTFLKEVVEILDGKMLIKGKVENIDFSDKDGFITGFYTVMGTKGNIAKVFVKNENIICWLNKEILVSPPDSILSFDPIKLQGIHNSKIYKGQEIVLIARAATKIWRSKKAKAIFHPRKFGFNLNSRVP